MKIFHFISSLSGGGAERQLSYLAPELIRLGHDVHIAYLMEGPQKPELPGVVLHQFKAKSNYDPYLIWQALKIIKKIKPNIVQTWNLQMDFLGGLAARLNKVPWILREPSSVMAYPSNWKFRLRVYICSKANAVVSNSYGGDQYWKFFLTDNQRYIIPNALPIDDIERIAEGLPSVIVCKNVPIVLYVGRLSSGISGEKNLRLFLEVLAHILSKKKIFGVLCGDGLDRKELEALSCNLGLQGDVFFTGQQPAEVVWALMKKASVFVSLSAFEGCPNTVMEAMACGCPLVLSDIPGHREILDEASSFFVIPSDIKHVANTIIYALDNVQVSRDHVLVAKQKAWGNSISKMAHQYESLYNDIIGIN